MPIGTILLAIIAVLIFFGVFHRVLDRMKLSDRAALAILVAIAVGSFFEFTILRAPVMVRANLGGAIIPVVVAVWLVVTSDEASEKVRAVVASLVTGVIIYGMRKVLPAEEQVMLVSPMILYGVAAGIIAAVSGRSRRNAFIAGLSGQVLADIFHWIELAVTRTPGTVAFGGAGALDVTIIGAILAVGFVELTGEAREKVVKSTGEGDKRERE